MLRTSIACLCAPVNDNRCCRNHAPSLRTGRTLRSYSRQIRSMDNYPRSQPIPRRDASSRMKRRPARHCDTKVSNSGRPSVSAHRVPVPPASLSTSEVASSHACSSRREWHVRPHGDSHRSRSVQVAPVAWSAGRHRPRQGARLPVRTGHNPNTSLVPTIVQVTDLSGTAPSLPRPADPVGAIPGR